MSRSQFTFADIPFIARRPAGSPPAPPASSLKAWWPFEDVGGTPPWVDVINSEQIEDDAFSPGYAAAVAGGKIGNTLRQRQGSGFSGSTNLNTVGVGPLDGNSNLLLTSWTLTTWIRLHDFAAGDSFAIYLDGSAASGTATRFNATLYWATGASAWTIQLLDDGGSLQLNWNPSVTLLQDTWYFLRWSYNQATGKFVYQLDNGAEQSNPDSYSLTTTATGARWTLNYTDDSGGGTRYVEWDELNIWDGVLSADDVSTIWNGGSGTTRP